MREHAGSANLRGPVENWLPRPQEHRSHPARFPLRHVAGMGIGLHLLLQQGLRQDNARPPTSWDAGRITDEPRSTDEAWQTAARTLAENPYDLPFVLIYLMEAENRAACLGGFFTTTTLADRADSFTSPRPQVGVVEAGRVPEGVVAMKASSREKSRGRNPKEFGELDHMLLGKRSRTIQDGGKCRLGNSRFLRQLLLA